LVWRGKQTEIERNKQFAFLGDGDCLVV
jgi:hypothetical protein